MAKPSPNPEPQRNRADNDRRLQAAIDAINGRLRGAEPVPAAPIRGVWREEALPPSAEGPAEAPDVERVQAENEELRMEIGELRQLLDESTARAVAPADDQDGDVASLREEKKAFEDLLDEKTELIRTLHLKIQELDKQAASRPAAAPNENDLLALSDELERERCQLDQERRRLEEDRRQLKDDEQSMMTQMREMEVQMAKERAEMARQRNELQRLHSEIRHEIEVAQRDGLLNERLKTLSRKHQEVSNRKGAAPEAGKQNAPADANPPPQAPKKDSSILRRFFGSGK